MSLEKHLECGLILIPTMFSFQTRMAGFRSGFPSSWGFGADNVHCCCGWQVAVRTASAAFVRLQTRAAGPCFGLEKAYHHHDMGHCHKWQQPWYCSLSGRIVEVGFCCVSELLTGLGGPERDLRRCRTLIFASRAPWDSNLRFESRRHLEVSNMMANDNCRLRQASEQGVFIILTFKTSSSTL